MLRLAIIEDHTMFLQLLVGMLRSYPSLEIAATGTTIAAGRKALVDTAIDLLILDLDLPDGDGIDLLRGGLDGNPDLRCIVLSGEAQSFRCPPDLKHAIHAVVDKTHAYDYLRISIEDLMAERQPHMKETVPSPRTVLTDRELEIFRLMGVGLTSKEISSRLSLSHQTVETHRKNISRKIGISGADLIRHAVIFNQTLLD